MTLADVHFSSATDLRSTPQELFNSCDKIFRFAVDVCAPPDNAKCAKYFTPEGDGLKQEWTGTCCCNPPYGRGIGKWMRKARESVKAGAAVVCLVPARADTRWWHDYATKGHVLFLRGRLKFGDAEIERAVPLGARNVRRPETLQEAVRRLRQSFRRRALPRRDM